MTTGTGIPGRLNHPARSDLPWEKTGVWLLCAVMTAALLTIAGSAISHRNPIYSVWPDHQIVRSLVSAGVIYLLGHALRVVRLTVLLGHRTGGLRGIAAAHFMTATLDLLAPLKLGELTRLYYIAQNGGGSLQAIRAVWLERAFDAAAIVAILLINAGFAGGSARPLLPAITLASVFLTATFLLFIAIPQNLDAVKIFAARRYSGKRGLSIAKGLYLFGLFLEDAPRMLLNKTATMTSLTFGIWAADITAFWILAPSAAMNQTLTGPFRLTSSVSQAWASLFTGTSNSGNAPDALVVTVFVTVLSIAGLASGYFYARRMIR